ncbi:tail fiber assembly protein [Serratia rubidaea]|uniref:hypothetical protein n=1 Tax=Serratia rubidaea TaxID=61652 RepID=UPI0017810098|nr:hypothetical protein [Serratia rubidaea]MBD8451893.1 hypothetical protein [Serratia rubidaea]
MKEFKGFKSYKPDETSKYWDISRTHAIAFIKSEDGIDWYDAQNSFQSDTVKLMYDDEGLIVCASHCASGMFPVDRSVVEVSESVIPDGFAPDMSWRYLNGEVVKADS